MIHGEVWYMMRELLRQGLSVSEVARHTGHDRKTIRKVRDAASHPPPQKRQAPGSKLDPYKSYLRQRVAAGVLNASKLFMEVQRQGYSGGVAQLRRFVHPLRPLAPRVTERFETPPGRRLDSGELASPGRLDELWPDLVSGKAALPLGVRPHAQL